MTGRQCEMGERLGERLAVKDRQAEDGQAEDGQRWTGVSGPTKRKGRCTKIDEDRRPCFFLL